MEDQIDKELPGEVEDAVCCRDGCTGIMGDSRDGGCSCHMHPPCHYCRTTHVVCDTCDAEFYFVA